MFQFVSSDLIVASPKAEFALPEVLRGLYAGAGGLARIVRDCGMRIGSELALTGRRVPAEEALQLRLINRIAKSPESVLNEAIEMAKDIASKSPDAIIVSRSGLREAWETASTIEAGKITTERYGKKLMASENLRIGLEAFAAKKQPQWVASKL
jgi:enoyl-CoA hydratase/carnithine racemase